jgi:hypothetical protein
MPRSSISCFRRSKSFAVPPGSSAVGVPHPAANHAASVNVVPSFDAHSVVFAVARLEPFPSDAFGLGHPPDSLTDVRRIDARSAQIGGPEPIGQCFQVSAYSGAPRPAKRARNLLSSDDCRAALLDESSKMGPEVTGVSIRAPASCHAEGLAGAASRPERSVVGPSSQSSCEGPPSDSSEEVGLGVSLHVIRLHLLDAALVHVARRNVPGVDQVPKPLRCIGVDLVVVGRHHVTSHESEHPSGVS